MKIKFNVSGMTCAACSSRVERVTAVIPGVNRVEVNLLKGTMIVTVESDTVVPEIMRAISDAGYSASIFSDKKNEQLTTHDATVQRMKLRSVISFVFLLALMYFTMGHMIGLPVPHWYHGVENAVIAAFVQLALTLPVVFLNREYYTRGLKALWHRSPNMDSLIAVGSLAALIYGLVTLLQMAAAAANGDWNAVRQHSQTLYFESAAMILTLITFGKFLEARAKGRTGDAIRQLMDLSPKTATVLRDGLEVELPLDQVKVGDLIVVRSGGGIPVDGTVLEGRGSVDQSALTGESIPVDKSVGDTVAAATINMEGYLLLRADKVGDDTSLAQIIRLVEDAGGTKAPIARIADKVAGVFVPVVMGVAVVAFAVWMLLGESFSFSLGVGISVLVISCPCALGLATPVAIMVATGKGANMGALFKNAEALETLQKIDTVVLDKTGTVTVGRPSITDVLPGDADVQMLLKTAAALESKSEHPFAKAILESVSDLKIQTVADFQTLPGLGVSGALDGTVYYGGNKVLMDQLDVKVPEFIDLKKQGKTLLYFASEAGAYLGAMAAADTLKEDSAETVGALRKLGLHMVMLTGDNATTAQAVAASIGIERVVSDVLPHQKSGIIEELRGEGKHVLMVGDGINDAPALITADVGMAIGTGTDIAIESANVVLMNSSLMGVYNAVQLSKATVRNIRQNLFWAFFYNCLGIPIAAGILYPAFGILLSPMIAAAAMSFSSVFVVSNALRLRLFKPREVLNKQEELYIQEEKVMETVINVLGMMCEHCKTRVENVCKAVPGTVDAVVDLKKKQVTVKGSASLDAIKQAIIDAGYEVVD